MKSICMIAILIISTNAFAAKQSSARITYESAMTIGDSVYIRRPTLVDDSGTTYPISPFEFTEPNTGVLEREAGTNICRALGMKSGKIGKTEQLGDFAGYIQHMNPDAAYFRRDGRLEVIDSAGAAVVTLTCQK